MFDLIYIITLLSIATGFPILCFGIALFIINLKKYLKKPEVTNLTKSDELNYLCQHCGKQLLKLNINKKCKQKEISTWYYGICDCCGEEIAVTEARDFGYPKLPNKD